LFVGRRRLGYPGALSIGVLVGLELVLELGVDGWIAGIEREMLFLTFGSLVMRMGLLLTLMAVVVLWVVMRRWKLEVRTMMLVVY
jgi:hypothetical protein